MHKIYIPKRFLVLFVLVSMVLSACVWPENEDPFERLPEEETITLEGEIFPFSVSVATRATHRLEKDNKLQMYLASEDLQLSEFEGFEAVVEGVVRKEKMREILWVQSLKIPRVASDGVENPDPIFHTKDIAFRYPENWVYTTAPNGVAYFSESNDPNRVVFLTFGVEEAEKEKNEIDPDIMLSNLLGNKSIEAQENGKQRELVTLYSNIAPTQYKFTFTSDNQELEKRKAFQKLLSSFKEGEENVKEALKAFNKEEMKVELKKIEALKEDEEVSETDSDQEGEEKEGLLEKIFGDKEEDKEAVGQEELAPEEIIEAKEEEPSEPQIVTQGFNNVIDERAFHYKSQYYNFEMDVPWGYWFQNFGPSSGKIVQVGFANNEIAGDKGAVDFWLEIISDPRGQKVMQETLTGEQLDIWFPHSSGKVFHMYGSQEFRDAMKSIQKTIQAF